ncbi:MAG TPA: SRPBCC domain-containing protein [Terriglobales bacterium]|nr:SRPBCC domain-containing protein [Terriglobales bacterium]
MKNDLRFEAVYPYSPERVWRALTDPVELGQWLMPNDFEARLGHKFQFKTRPVPGFDGIVNCEVTELDVPRRLEYKWRADTSTRW